MATEKTLNSRIVHKHDTEANWLKAINFTPKQGELIIYDKDANYNYERAKIGDGQTNVNNLPFIVDTSTLPEDIVRISLLTQIEEDLYEAISNNSIEDKKYIDNLLKDYYTKTEIENAIEDIIDGTIPVAKATHSSTADSSTTATKATQDGNGKVISTTYATNETVNQVATNAQSYTDEAINTLAANVAYIDENDNETVTLSVDLDVLASLIGGDA